RPGPAAELPGAGPARRRRRARADHRSPGRCAARREPASTHIECNVRALNRQWGVTYSRQCDGVTGKPIEAQSAMTFCRAAEPRSTPETSAAAPASSDEPSERV